MKRQGADLAVVHLNADGGIGGRPLRIVYSDSKNSTTEAKIGFDKLVDADRVPLVMSAMSQVSLSLVGPADRRKVVLFANASHPDLVRRSEYAFRNMPSTATGATAMADTAYRELGHRKVALLHINDEYGLEAVEVFRQRFQSLGGTVTGTDSFEFAGTDFRAQLRKLAAADPEAYWIPGFGSALGLVLKQKAELQVPGQVLADLGMVDDNVIDTAGEAAEGVIVVAPAFDPTANSPAVKRFVTDYRQEHGEAPSFDAAFQYDAVQIIAQALGAASESTGEALQQQLAKLEPYTGVCGLTSFDANGEAEMTVVVRQLVGGELKPLVAETIVIDLPGPGN